MAAGLAADGSHRGRCPATGIVAPLPLQPAALAEADHVVGQARSQQGFGQLISGALIRRHRQQVHIRAGIPVAAGQGAEQPHLRSSPSSQQGLDAAAQGFNPLAAQSLANLLHARHGWPRRGELRLSSSGRLGRRCSVAPQRLKQLEGAADHC